MSILESKGSWERAEQLYPLFASELESLESTISNSYESETKKLSRKKKILEHGLANVQNVLELHSFQYVDDYYDNLSIGELIRHAATEEAIRKYDVREAELTIGNEKRKSVMITAHSNSFCEIGMIIDTSNFITKTSDYMRAYFKSKERMVGGSPISCQHVYAEIERRNGADIVANIRKVELKGKQGLVQTISTLIQELYNWENKIYPPINAFDTQLIIRIYKSLEQKLCAREKESLSEAFGIVADYSADNLKLCLKANFRDSKVKEYNFIRTYELFSNLPSLPDKTFRNAVGSILADDDAFDGLVKYLKLKDRLSFKFAAYTSLALAHFVNTVNMSSYIIRFDNWQELTHNIRRMKREIREEKIRKLESEILKQFDADVETLGKMREELMRNKSGCKRESS